MISYVGGLLRTGMLFALLVGFWNQQIESGVHVRKVCFFLGIALYEILLEWLTVPAVVRYLPILLFSVAYCYLFHICKWEKPVFLLLLLYNLHTMSFLITNSIYQMFVKWLDGKLDETAPDVIDIVLAVSTVKMENNRAFLWGICLPFRVKYNRDYPCLHDNTVSGSAHGKRGVYPL